MSPVTAAPTVPEMLARRQRIRETEALFRTRALRDLDQAHADVAFYRLLDTEERRRLGRLLPDAPPGDPLGPDAPTALRTRWNELARSYLRRVLALLDRVKPGRAELSPLVSPQWPHGIHLLTAHGSRVTLSAPDLQGLRAYRYDPLRGDGLPGRSSRVGLTKPIELGRSLPLGSLRTSPVALLVQDLARQGAWDVPPRSGAATLLRPARRADPEESASLGRYLVRLDLLEEDAAAGFGADLQECEALGEALFLQWLHAPAGDGFPLEAVAAIITANGTRYLVEPMADRSGEVEVRRIGLDGKEERLCHVNIGPQRVARGAPLVLFARVTPGGEERAACLTSPVARVELRRAAYQQRTGRRPG